MKIKLLFISFLILGLSASASAQNWIYYNSSNSSLPGDSVWGVVVDGTTIWASTYGGGLVKIENDIITQIIDSGNSILKNNLICPVLPDGNNLWIGTDENDGLYKLDVTTGTMILYDTSNSSLESGIIYEIEKDSSGNLWIGTRFGGLTKFDGTNWITYRYQNSPLTTDIIYGIATKGDEVWVGGYNSGLVHINDTTWTTYNTWNSPLPSVHVYSLFYDENTDELWIGTANGLARLTNGNWTVFTTSNSNLPHNYIRQVTKDKEGKIWVATDGGGIAYFTNSSFTTYNVSNGLPSNRIYMMDFDMNNRVYVATFEGGLAVSNFTSNKVIGNVFLDLNNNGIKDVSETGFYNAFVGTIGNNYSNSTQPDTAGNFTIFIDTGSYQTSIINLPYYISSPAQHNTIFNSYGLTDTINFGVVPIPGIQDLRITTIPLLPARPGFQTKYRISYSNHGTDTVSGDIYFVMDSGMTFLSSLPPEISINNDTIVWDYVNLVPGESRNIDIMFLIDIPPNVNNGDILVTWAMIDPVSTDTVPMDNEFVLSQIVTGSYDPNDKTLLIGEFITTTQVNSNEYLTYLIRFQNTGTDTAFTVVVRDTLDNNLNLTSLEMVSSSHHYTLSIENQKNLSWTFNNILLPDSNVNEAGSHGYITYRIQPLSTLQQGDLIKNTAYIYFDYNLPIITNTVVTPVLSPVSVPDIISNGSGNISIYPNPFTDVLNIKSNSGAITNVLIINNLGQIIKSFANNSNELSFELNELSAGIYTIQIMMDSSKVYERVIKISNK